jgi:VWFA-related protein
MAHGLKRLCILIALLSGVSGRAELSAQVKTKAPEALLQHQVTVTLKLIQVFVAGPDGKPALGLESSDFVLYDNGIAQTITDFERHVLAAPPAGRAEAALSPIPAPTPAPLLDRKFIFLIDYQRNELEGIKKAKTAAIEFVDTKTQPGDEVALYSFSAVGGLKLHEDLTADRAKVRAAIDKLRDVPGITPVGDESLSPDHEPMGMELMNQQLFGRGSSSSGPAIRSLFAEVAEWAKVLRNIPGQKNIILYSRGFGRTVVQLGDPAYFAFQTMSRELASANARVFAVNTTTGVMAKIALGVFPEDSLDTLARTTGGKYFNDVNYSTEIASDIQNATASYYVLGFPVPAVWDGKYHNVKVEVRRRGYEVRAQRGYFNPLPFAKLSAIEKHIQLLGLVSGESATAKRVLEFPMTAVPFAAAGGANTLVLSEIPVASIRDAVGDRTELVALILNSAKAIVDGKRVEVDWTDQPAGRLVQYAAVALAPGHYDCWAVVRNLDDGRAAVGLCTVDVPVPEAKGPVMSPPLFLRRGTEARYLNLVSQEEKGGGEGFSISRIFPFPAKEYVPLVGALDQGVTSVSAELRCVWGAERGGEKDLSARLWPEGSEEEIPITTDLVSGVSRGEEDFYLLDFEFSELKPGRYRLEIQAEDTRMGSVVKTAATFSVRPPA